MDQLAPIFPFAFVAVFLAVGGAVRYFRAQAERAVLRELAARLGLTHHPQSWTSAGDQVAGELDGTRVELVPVTVARGKSRVRYTRYVAHGPRGDFAFKKQRAWEDLVQAVAGQDLQVGDPVFDREVVVSGDADRITPLLDAATRERILTFLRSGPGTAQIGVGVVSRQVQGRVPSAATAELRLREVKELAAVLGAAGGDERAALIRIVRADPLPGVRCRALRQLLKRHADAEVEAVLEGALRDPAAEVRLLAATGRGDLDVLLALAADRAVDHPVRTAASIEAEAVLPSSPPPRPPDPARIPDLERVVAEETDVPLRTSALRCLAALAPERARAAHAGLVPDIVADALVAAATAPALLGRAAEPGLLTLLGHADGDVRRAAAEALGLVGTVAAVAPLHRVGDERLGLTAAALAARRAIEQIQGRAERAEVGQLSLAAEAPLVGAVAVATGDVGAVGLAEAVRAPPPKDEDAAEAAQPRPAPQGIRG